MRLIALPAMVSPQYRHERLAFVIALLLADSPRTALPVSLPWLLTWR